MKLPPQHKKRLYQGIFAYVLIMALAAGGVYMTAGHAVKAWQERIPVARTTILGGAETDTPENISADTSSPAQEKNQEKPAAGTQKTAVIALIMTDAGISDSATAKAIADLPKEVALAFSPYPPAVKEGIKKAVDAGHGILMLAPMEPLTYPQDDPGPKTLLGRLSDKENIDNLTWVLSRAGTEVPGIMNSMGAKFMNANRSIEAVFKFAHDKGLFFIENPQGGASHAEEAAASADMSYAAADIIVDKTVSSAAIRQQLENLATLAQAKGHAVGILQPYPASIDLVKEWSASLDSRGIKLVPLKEILKHSFNAAHDEEVPEPPAAGIQQP